MIILRAFFLVVMTLLGVLLGMHQGLAQNTPPLTGRIIDYTTRQPLGYVSLSVPGQRLGTTANGQGYFSLALPSVQRMNNADSVRFSLVGYAPLVLELDELRRRLYAGQPVILRARPVPLREAVVRAVGLKRRVLGNPGNSSLVFFMFDNNKLGNQVGQRIKLVRPGLLEEVAFHIKESTYDTLFYRVNVYSLKDDFPDRNLLPEAVYVRVPNSQTHERVIVDLRSYQLWLTSDVVVALELVKALGPGTLKLRASLFSGPAYSLEHMPGIATIEPKIKGVHSLKAHWEQGGSGGTWTKAAAFGIGIEATVLQESR